jgi:uncharacterized protein (DUF39 family)
MTADNFDQAMLVLRSRKPYQVFTVELNGGRRFEVDYPGALSWREGVAVFLAPGGIPVFFDHESVNQIIVAPANTSL